MASIQRTHGEDGGEEGKAGIDGRNNEKKNSEQAIRQQSTERYTKYH